ncbi:cupredoxin domain-containing protein [Nitrolancea hollandica]|uniref:Blue (Type 1) copper domain protein n=1 Tax=Nitrolancea hollandica Lb TaxID=1129897 RepID=I4EIQ9_9BACT|nr:cupredoxin family copper-binding protein [Nitrolancea hollandica]CCF84571.1 Blue (Type 1) copper domain protein [Nitrolancea hollandica Lb]
MLVPALVRGIPALLLLVSIVALAGCGAAQPAASTNPPVGAATSTQPASSEEVQVRIVDFAFEPSTITIKPGTTVVWTNDGPTQHTTASKEGNVWESKILEQGDVFRYRFEQPGTFPYWCTLHPSMLGTVIVAGN